eukprot:TRINITY_DN39097_c0_g1_i1.p1 TRINITY_DN39097_c0_g1~~TRINITY_DN39097_c0_g1_i1.p1  ORF type:complete len:142 (+),score=30.95 TRINITY_DN39097_c0_g1_i1:131-556(+)
MNIDIVSISEDTPSYRHELQRKMEKLFEIQKAHLREQHQLETRVMRKVKKLDKQKSSIAPKPCAKKVAKWDKEDKEWKTATDAKLKEALLKSSSLSAQSHITDLLMMPLMIKNLQTSREIAESTTADGTEPHPSEYEPLVG